MNSAMLPARRLHRIILWLAPSIFVTYPAIRWSFEWSPVHETKTYLYFVATRWVYGAVMTWMLTVPLMMLTIALFNIFKWKYPRLTMLSTVAFILLYTAFLNEFGYGMEEYAPMPRRLGDTSH